MVCPITGGECKCTMKEQLRKLFTEHAVYTKFFIESKLTSLPDLDVITNRLLRNQKDIGDFIKPIVGENNGNMATKLLQEHILAAAGAVEAVKDGNTDKINNAINKVFANSKQVAQFLSSLNPEKLPFDAVLKMFNEHNQHVIDMAIAHSQNKFDEEIKHYDSYYTHMLALSDTLHAALEPAKTNRKLIFIIIFVVLIVIAKMKLNK